MEPPRHLPPHRRSQEYSSIPRFTSTSPLYTAAVYKEIGTRWRFCDHCSAKSAVLHEFDEQRTENHALTQFDLFTAAVYKENGTRCRFGDHCSAKSAVLHESGEQRT